MAGADGGQFRAVTRCWAASFVARLFTGAATRAQLLAEEDVFSGGSSLYRSISTKEDDVESDGDTGRGSSDLGVDADDSDQEQLLAEDDGEDPRRARSVCCLLNTKRATHDLEKRSVCCERSLSLSLSHGLQHTVSSKAQELSQPHLTGAAPRSRGAAMEAPESEPLMLRRREAKRVNDVVETVDHPFGCGRREESSSSLLTEETVAASLITCRSRS